jgi:hypothetical protein
MDRALEEARPLLGGTLEKMFAPLTAKSQTMNETPDRWTLK